MGTLFLFVGLLLALVAACVAPIKVKMDYIKNNEDDLIRLEIIWLYIWRQRISIPMIALSAKKIDYQVAGSQSRKTSISLGQLARQLGDVAKNWSSYVRLGRELYSGLEVKGFSWETRFGLPDAAETAWSVGALWGIKSVLAGQMTRLTRYRGPMPRLKVVPLFNSIGGKVCWEMEMSCEYRVRPTHVLFWVYRLWRDQKKKGKQRG